MTPLEEANLPSFPFLGLPVETRRMVYDILLEGVPTGFAYMPKVSLSNPGLISSALLFHAE